MNPLLLAGGLATARRCVAVLLHRAALSAAAYSVLAIFGLVAAGFLTAAGFLYLAETHGTIQTCLVIAAIYAVTGIFGFLVLLLMRGGRTRAARPSAAEVAAELAASSANEGFPGGIASIVLLAAAGYLLGKSMTRKRK